MYFLFLIFLTTFLPIVLAEGDDENRKFLKLPELKPGEECEPGKLYRDKCNSCECGSDHVLTCTRMLCSHTDWKAMLEKKKHNLRSSALVDLPDLPQSGCVPGKMYKYTGKSGCSRCFCDNHGIPECTLMKCDEVMADEIPVMDRRDLPSLDNVGSKCEPGRKYRVDCNSCICKHDGNLSCTKMFCLHVGYYNKQEAMKQSGQPCKPGYEAENDCVRCICEGGLLKCTAVENCVYSTNALLRSGSTNVKIAIRPQEDACLPGMVYKSDCNKCFCQNGTLRCTVMKCLNYKQSLKLQQNLKALQSAHSVSG